MNYKAALLIIASVIMLTGFGSCVREDMSDCPDGYIRVQLKLDVDVDVAGSRAAEFYQIDATRLFVFDSQDRFVTAVDGGPYVAGEDYFLYPEIGPGDYHFVVWTNMGDHYKTTHSLQQCHEENPVHSDIIFYYEIPEDGHVRTDIPDLHHGALPGATVEAYKDNHFSVELSPNVNRVNISVEGLSETADEYGFTISDNNSRYLFDNSFGPCTGLNYIRTTQFENNELGASIKVLRLEETRTPVFTFDNKTTGTVLFTDDLIDMIQSAYAVAGKTVDFDKTHTFDIVLRFDINMDVTVTVNGWNYTYRPGILE